MDLQEIFELSDQQISLLDSLLSRAINLFPTTYVPTELFQQGFTYHNGVIVQIKDVEHKFLLDYYEKTFLQTFHAFFLKMAEEKTSQTNIFALRVLLELSVENSFLIFNTNVESEDKKLFLLMTLLVDYAAIDTPLSEQFYSWFVRLFNENAVFLKSSLSEKELILVEQLKAALLQNGRKVVLIKKVRKLLNQVKARALNNYQERKIYSPTDNYIGLSSGLSHIMHGNVLLLENSLKPSSKNNHILRVYAHLFISGISLLDQVVLFHSNPEFSQLVTEFKDQHNLFAELFKDAWKKHSELKTK